MNVGLKLQFLDVELGDLTKFTVDSDVHRGFDSKLATGIQKWLAEIDLD